VGTVGVDAAGADPLQLDGRADDDVLVVGAERIVDVLRAGVGAYPPVWRIAEVGS
jgi:hypothetical protein